MDEAIAHCAAILAKDERIVCLESALRALESADRAARRPPASSDKRRDPGETESVRAPTPVPEPVAPPAEMIAPPEQPESGGRETGPVAAELGSEQVATRNDANQEATIVSATVVDFDFVGYRRLLVQLDNGQIWRQIDGDRVSVERGLRDEDSFDVEMWETGLGGYRMRILPLDRTIRVERLR